MFSFISKKHLLPVPPVHRRVLVSGTIIRTTCRRITCVLEEHEQCDTCVDMMPGTAVLVLAGPRNGMADDYFHYYMVLTELGTVWMPTGPTLQDLEEL